MKTLRYLSEVVVVMLSVGVGLAPSMLPSVRSNQWVFVKVMSSIFDRSALKAVTPQPPGYLAKTSNGRVYCGLFSGRYSKDGAIVNIEH